MSSLVVTLGAMVPSEAVESRWFALLAAFVAVNTVMYVALSIAKAFPRVHPRDFLPRRYHRTETRSIHPDSAP